MAEVYRMLWPEVMIRVEKLCERPELRGRQLVYGVPRGGAVVAGLVGRDLDFQATQSLEAATLIVDDIVDSGRTKERYARLRPGVPFLALVDKSNGDKDLGWVVFPWEEPDPSKDLEDTVVRQLEFIGQDPKREGLLKTPGRYLKALKELTEGYGMDPKAILGTVFSEACDEMVVVRDIPFWSLCEHHLLPFQGHATVGYIPDGKVVGLSKLARLVHAHARRLQVQERMTHDIAGDIEAHLSPQGVGVVVRASHTCMAMRGVRTPAEMLTSSL